MGVSRRTRNRITGVQIPDYSKTTALCQLAPYQAEERPITRQTVIYNDLSIDSLAVMDIIMELEDRFDVFIPINTVAEIHTVDELADAILRLQARR